MIYRIFVALFSITFVASLWFGFTVTDNGIAFECFDGVSYVRGYLGYAANLLPGFVAGVSFAAMVFYATAKR